MIDTRLDRTKLRTKHRALGVFKMQTVAMGWCQVVPKGLCALAPDDDKIPWDSICSLLKGIKSLGLLTLDSSLRRNWGCGDDSVKKTASLTSLTSGVWVPRSHINSDVVVGITSTTPATANTGMRLS